jgi:hypothetical protein
MKLKLENLINEQDKDFIKIGAVIGLIGSALYGTVSNIHDWQDFIQIGVKWGDAYWKGFGTFAKTALYAVPITSATGYVASKVSNLFDK